MGQHISLSDCKIPDLLATNNQQSNEVSSANETEDIHLFLPFDIINEINKNYTSLPNQKISNELLITKDVLINQIRNDISDFSNLFGVKKFDMEIAEIIKKMFDHIATMNTNLQNSMQLIINKQEQLKNSYSEKLKDDENEMNSVFSETLIDREKKSDEQQVNELSFFAVQSLITMLLMLLESIHKFDSTIINEMLNLTNQLFEQIPLNYLSSDVYKRSDNLFKSLKPLTNYIQELSTQTDIDPIVANQSIKFLFNFSVMKASFKDILPLIRKLIFNTNDIFDIRNLLIKLNKHLTMMLDRFQKEKQTSSIPTTIPQNNTTDNNITTQIHNRTEAVLPTEKALDIEQKLLAAVEYLKLIEAYPNIQLIKLNEKKFTGQFICSILLVHIDLHNQFHAKSKFEHGSMNGSFSFELEAETFKYLYEIIEQLTIVVETSSDTNLGYILNVCLRLLTTHLQFLIGANFDNFHDLLNENDIEKWFTLVSKLAFDDKLEERKKEASHALIYLIEKQILSFSKMLTFIHKHIIENRHPILIDQLLNKLNQQVFIYKWIEILCDDQDTQDRTLAYIVLHSFIDIVLQSTFVDIEKVNRLREIIIIFQELLLVYFNNQPIDISNELESSALSTLGIEYTTHVIKSCLQQEIQSILFEPLLLGLCTLTESKFNFAVIQPIFAAVMPLFAEYIIQTKIDINDKTNYLISWLLGKMSHRLIVGPPQSPLEKKYNKTLKLPLFSGGYETLTTDINSYLSNLFKSDLIPFNVDMITTDNNLLKLSKENDGFLLSLDNHQELTISFDFEISTTENRCDELDIVLFTLDDAIFSIHVCMNDNFINETKIYRQHVAILFQINKQAKLYTNNKFQTLNYYHSFDSKLNLRLLPCLNVGFRNLGIWTYLLSEEHIQRLFTYGLSHVAIDYQKLKEYQQRLNTIEFKAEQKYFTNETLVPFNEPFKSDLWEETKQSINHDESNYFKTIPDTNQSIVQLFGNKTYLVLNTANQIWSEYTLILDISIPNFPSAKNLLDSEARLTLLTLDNKSEIYVTHDGHLHVTGEHQSSSTVKLQEYIRLFISVQQNSIHIYVNGSLEVDVSFQTIIRVCSI
ncbi:unnamed protein product [Rotaria sordida]|uniref:Uncharacterized protein n=1 Tax=Rotaria sordida TaxID=392033 RepID=A0A814QAE7_9BILA|nr:unnamed protein product [Rotaria sordida]